MPIENKEELYSLLYEFDDTVAAMIKTMKSVDVDKAAKWELTPKEYELISIYRERLNQLRKCYDEIDRNLAYQAQNEES